MLAEAERATIQSLIGQMRESGRLGFLAWAWAVRPMLASARPFDLAGWPFLAELYQRGGDPRVVIVKAGQTGVSEYAISWILWRADQRNQTGLYILPTDSAVSDFAAARLGAALDPEVAPDLASVVIRAGPERGVDRVTLKRIRDRWIYFRGGKVDPEGNAPQLRSVDAGSLVVDELDAADLAVLPLAMKRLEGSADPAYRLISTPTYPGRGIDAEYQKTDRRRWSVKCGHCGRRQFLGLGHLITEWDDLDRPAAWHGGADPFLACEKCGKRLDRSGPGEWVAESPDRPIRGYWIPGLAAPRKSLADLVAALQKIEEHDRQQAYNQTLGLPYVPRSESLLSPPVLDLCRRDYRLGPLPPSKPPRPGEKPAPRPAIYAGIDVGRVLHVVIRTEDGRALFLGLANWAQIGALWAKYGVVAGAIDALPETQKARELQAAIPGLWLCYYSADMKQAEAARWNFEEQTATIDRTRALDSTLAAFAQASRGERGLTLPAEAREIADYYDQILAPRRVLSDSTNRATTARYIETGPDHYAHAEVYCYTIAHAPAARLRVRTL